MSFKTSLVAALALTLSTGAALAAPIFSPTDTIYGVASNGTQITVGEEGFDGGANNWPGAEGPEHAIDGVGQKYLNFAELNAGLLIGLDEAVIATSLQIWAANDAEERDPASFELYGTNLVLSPSATPGATADLSFFNLIASGDLDLPSTRNPGGTEELDDAASQIVTFDNSQAYLTYLILFPTVKDADNANSVQLAELQLYTTDTVAPVPLPASLPFLLVGLGGLGLMARRKA